ncbi:MAG: PAS domain-containing protein, partial [Arcicella sp.]|nr:PAS domain-containing protein [Arcicella sp.]
MKKMEDLSVNKKLNFLYGGGEMGERIRNFDWSKTPLGNPENWDSSLKTYVRIVLTSSQPMFIWWGDKLINIYNDACKGVLGRKHPAMLGVTGKIVWDEVWDELWTRGKTVFENNQGTFDDALLLIMNRNGYEEETYFKFSFNPIPGTIKTTEGLLCVSTEETSRIYNERALDMLRELGAITYTEKSLDIIYRHVAEALATNHKDFPFALIYKITGEANIVTVVASTGIDKSQNVFPDNIDITKPTAITKDFCQAFKENKMVVSEIQAEDVTLPTGAWQTTPKQFIHLPISPAGSKQPYCIISAALNPYRTFDEKYLQFCQLIADRISTEINKMLAIEVEAKRAEALAEIDRAKIVVFSNIIHEFRTPLTLILSPLEEILNQKKNNLNKTEKQNIEIAHRNSMRLFDMVNNLLDFSNIEKGELNKGSVFTVKIPFDQQHVSEHQIIGTEMNADEITSDTYIAKIEISLETEKNETVQIVAVKEKNILPTVLVVDDNTDVRKHISTILSENFNVITANHGMDALLLIRKTTPDLVISDIWMYVMDGISLLKEIKSDKATANIPVILLIASAGENSKVLDWEMGADDYMVKPFSAKELVARVKAQLRMVKLRQSLEGNVRNLFLQSPVAIAILKGPQHIFELANDMYMHLAQNNDVVGKSIRQVFPELEGTAIYELLDHVYSTGEPFVANEMLVKLNKGNEKLDENYFNLVYQPSRDKDGKIDGVITHGVDVTEQVLARKKIEESEHRYHEIIYTSPSLIAIFKGEDMIIDIANDAILDSWGKGNIIGKSIFDVMPESIEQGFDKLLLSVYRTGESILGNEVPVTFYRKGTKEIIYYNFVYQAQRNVHGEIEGVATIATEVTSQAELNKKIKESEEQFRNVWLQSPNIFVILKGPEMVIDFVNEPLLRSWGRTNDIVGKTILEALPETKHQAFPRLLEEVYKTGKTYFGKEEKAVIIKDDEPEDVYYNYVYQAIQEDGKVSGITVMATDVTEQVVARKKVEESEKQQAFMLKLSDALRPLSNPVDIEEAVTKIALDFMEADWCHYCTIDGDNLIILRDAVRGDLPHLVGEYQISNYPLFNNILSAGCASVVHDVHTTDLLDEDLKQLCMQLQNISFINVPVIKNGKSVGLLSIVQSKPRKWTDSEVQLTIETAERTWAAVERAKAEEALRKSEEKYRTLFNSIDEAVSTIDVIFDNKSKATDFRFIENNAAFTRLTGLPEDVIGKRWLEFVPTIDPFVAGIFESVIRTGEAVRAENYVKELDKWHNTYFTLLGGAGSNRITCVYSDITQHKQAEEKLRESESRFRKMADASPMFIWTLDANGLSSYYNKTFL